jgi:Sortase and related acyltransferases
MSPREAHGKGVGRALLGRLIAQAQAQNLRQMVAIIGDSANHASIGLHEALGFERTGVLRSVGFKHGRWVDSVVMQRALGAGDAALALILVKVAAPASGLRYSRRLEKRAVSRDGPSSGRKRPSGAAS